MVYTEGDKWRILISTDSGPTSKEARYLWISKSAFISLRIYHHIGDCILLFDKEGKYLRKFGCKGSNVGQLNTPADIIFVSDDEILVADELNNRIRLFSVHTGEAVKAFGKKGTAEGELKSPQGVCMDGEGRVVVADCRNNRM